jgi:hypothetical protein
LKELAILNTGKIDKVLIENCGKTIERKPNLPQLKTIYQ